MLDNKRAAAPLGRIPVERIIAKLDSLFAKNNYAEAGRLLLYWRGEAQGLRDRSGELAIVNELVGYYRKQNEREAGLAAVERALTLAEELGQDQLAAGATVFLNCATAYKAFGMAEKAMPLYERALGVYERVLAPNDARFAGLYNNMALALEDLGEFPGAERAYRAALDIMDKVPGGEADAAITWVNLAHMYEKTGARSEIAPCMGRALALLETETLPRNGYYAFVLEKCALSFGHFGDVAAYERLKNEAERIYAGS